MFQTLSEAVMRALCFSSDDVKGGEEEMDNHRMSLAEAR